MTPLPPGLITDTDRHGNVRQYYHPTRASAKIRIYPQPGSDAFREAYDAAIRGEKTPKPASFRKRLPVGERTFAQLCQLYARSAAFLQLSPTTQQDRREILAACCRDETRVGSGIPMGDVPVREFGPAHVKALRDRKGVLAAAANNRVAVLSALFAWHIEGDDDAKNPCERITRLKTANPDGFHTWTLAEVAAYEAAHAIGTTARLAFDLALYTLQRRADLARLGPGNVRLDGDAAWLEIVTRKTGAAVTIPIIEPLALSLAARPHRDAATFIATAAGKPFTAKGLGNAMRAWCDAAGLPKCSLHGLRKAQASRMAELGVDTGGIGAALGHAPGSRATGVYTRAARQRVMVGPAFARLAESLPRAVAMIEGPRA